MDATILPARRAAPIDSDAARLDRLNDAANQHACCAKSAADERSVFVPETTAALNTNNCNGSVKCQVPDRNTLENHAHIDVPKRRVQIAELPTKGTQPTCPPLAAAHVSAGAAPIETLTNSQEMQDPIRIPIHSVPYRPIVPVLCTSCSHSNSDPSCITCSTGQRAMYTLSLDKQFLKALYWVRHAPPLAEQKLREHSARIEREALYYQIIEGDVNTPQPWAIQVEERERWDARNKIKGMTKEQAICQYLRKVSEVEPHWMESAEIMCYTPIEENPLDSKML